MPPLDHGAAVDRNDVAFVEYDSAGDAMDDDIVRRRADHRWEAVVTEKVGGRSPVVDHLATDRIKVSGRNARTNRGANLFVHLCNNATSRSHVAKFFFRTSFHVRSASRFLFRELRVDRAQKTSEDLVGRADSVDLHQQT